MRTAATSFQDLFDQTDTYIKTTCGPAGLENQKTPCIYNNANPQCASHPLCLCALQRLAHTPCPAACRFHATYIFHPFLSSGGMGDQPDPIFFNIWDEVSPPHTVLEHGSPATLSPPPRRLAAGA